MKVAESQDSYFTKQTVDRLNDLAAHAVQKVQSMPIVDLYTEHPIFRINSKNLHIQFKEFDEQANLIRQGNYAYDALGRRIEKVVIDLQVPANNKTRRYVYDGEDILKVFDENNQVISKYTHSSLRIDDALAIDNKQDNKSYYFLKDHLGSIVDIVNEDNTFKQHYAYSSFGELQKVTDVGGNDVTGNPTLEHHFAYTGREYDQESGLYHYRARAYDASTGRFLQVDPHSGQVDSPMSFINKYTYVEGSPISYQDSDGKRITLPAVYGNWCGPYNNDGKDWSKGTKDNVDARCKEHDQNYARADFYESDYRSSGNIFAPELTVIEEMTHYYYHHFAADAELIIENSFNTNTWKNSRGNFSVKQFFVAQAISATFVIKYYSMSVDGFTLFDASFFAVDKYKMITGYKDRFVNRMKKIF